MSEEMQDNTQTEVPQETPAPVEVSLESQLHMLVAQVNHAIGTRDWENVVSEITQHVCGIAKNMDNIRYFITDALAYDAEMIQSWCISKGNPNDVIYLAMNGHLIDSTALIMDYINTHEETHFETTVNVVNSYLKFVQNVNIPELADWAIETGRQHVLMAILLNVPVYSMFDEEYVDELFHAVLAEKKWSQYAVLFSELPGMIGRYDEDYQIRQRLAEVREEEKGEIQAWVNMVLGMRPNDTPFHVSIMNGFQNSYVNELFCKHADSMFAVAFGEQTAEDLGVKHEEEKVELTWDERDMHASIIFCESPDYNEAIDQIREEETGVESDVRTILFSGSFDGDQETFFVTSDFHPRMLALWDALGAPKYHEEWMDNEEDVEEDTLCENGCKDVGDCLTPEACFNEDGDLK